MSEYPNQYMGEVEENIIPSQRLDEWQAKLKAQCEKIEQDMEDLKFIMERSLIIAQLQGAQDARKIYEGNKE